MSNDLLPEQRAALEAALLLHYKGLPPQASYADNEAAAFLAGVNYERESCAKVCEAEAAMYHSEQNLSVRTDFGKEIAKAQGYGALNCANAIRHK